MTPFAVVIDQHAADFLAKTVSNKMQLTPTAPMASHLLDSLKDLAQGQLAAPKEQEHATSTWNDITDFHSTSRIAAATLNALVRRGPVRITASSVFHEGNEYGGDSVQIALARIAQIPDGGASISSALAMQWLSAHMKSKAFPLEFQVNENWVATCATLCYEGGDEGVRTKMRALIALQTYLERAESADMVLQDLLKAAEIENQVDVSVQRLTLCWPIIYRIIAAKSVGIILARRMGGGYSVYLHGRRIDHLNGFSPLDLAKILSKV